MSDDHKPEPKPGEASAQQYVANSNIDAHLIADMLRIESISNEVKAVARLVETQAEKADQRADRMEKLIDDLRENQIRHDTESDARMDKIDDYVEQLKKEVKKIEGWIFTIIGISITGLITLVITLAGVVG